MTHLIECMECQKQVNKYNIVSHFKIQHKALYDDHKKDGKRFYPKVNIHYKELARQESRHHNRSIQSQMNDDEEYFPRQTSRPMSKLKQSKI